MTATPNPSATYQLLDSGNFLKLEQVGPWRMVRPATQAVWRPMLPAADWQNVHATFQRFSGGDGKWTFHDRSLPESLVIGSTATNHAANIRLVIKPTDFGHLGIFPEQDRNWSILADLVAARVKAGRTETNVLNLFAYTGGSTLATAAAGARVVHVDASKTSVAWARENAAASKMAELPVRWIVEDVQKFVAREVRRGSRYHGIILDPPTFGRGTNNEVWQIEEHLLPLMDELRTLLAPDWSFVLLSAHSQGYTPIALENILRRLMHDARATFTSEEMIVRAKAGDVALPSGAACLMVNDAE